MESAVVAPPAVFAKNPFVAIARDTAFIKQRPGGRAVCRGPFQNAHATRDGIFRG